MVAQSFDTSAVSRLSAQVARTDSIGEIVLWSIPDRCEITIDAMKAAFSRLYWPGGVMDDGAAEPDLHDFCPRQPSYTLAMSRAVRGGAGNSRRLVAKAEDTDHATYGVIEAVIERSGADVDISARKELQAGIDKLSGTVTTDDSVVAGVLQQKVDHNRVHLSGRDLSGALIELVEHAQGIRLRPSGGDYFVPRTHLAIVRKMEAIVQETTHGTGYVSAFAVGSTPVERDHLSRHAHEALKREIADLDAEIEVLASRVTSGETVRPQTITERIKKAKALREKASLYEDLAEARVADVKQGLEQLIANCNAMLGFA